MTRKRRVVDMKEAMKRRLQLIRTTSMVVIFYLFTGLLTPSLAAACEGGGTGGELQFTMLTIPFSGKVKGAGKITVGVEDTGTVIGKLSKLEPEKPSGEWSWSEAAVMACKTATYSKKGESCTWEVTYAGKNKSIVSFLAQSGFEVHGAMIEGEP
jgi:hypothetical protein